MKKLKHNLWQVLLCFDQFCFCILCLFTNIYAWADCTLSAAAHMWRIKGIRYWPQKIIDAIFYIFEKNHCYNSYVSELKRRHFAPSMREV